jgi:hypothetical protein
MRYALLKNKAKRIKRYLVFFTPHFGRLKNLLPEKVWECACMYDMNISAHKTSINGTTI